MTSTKYRPDIDGLRSLAIIPVLLYHAGISGFSGGFVGVDVFFVISGYLITSILVREFADNSYSIVSFYERRIRRIFPALLLVIIFVLAASPFFLLPSEFASLGRDTLAALFFVANINFWRQSGYFAADAESKPLLHTWSLGVEEQFYLLAPLAFYLILRYAPRYRLLLVGGGLIASLALSAYLTPIKPGASFYLLPTRAWELLAGSWLAMYAARNTRTQATGPLHHLAGIAGLSMVLFAVFTYSRTTTFPGTAALAPALGAALLIYAGQHSWTGRLLSHKAPVMIGLLSYSLYLWHWPLIVFSRNAGILEHGIGKILVIALSLLAAWVTWRLVETPTRNRTWLTPRKLATTALAGTLVVTTVSIMYAQLDGWPSRFDSRTVEFDAARNDRSPERERCHVDQGLPPPTDACNLGGSSPKVAVWGDSHGVELAQAISMSGIPVKQLTYSSCPPATGWVKSDRPQCMTHNAQVFDYFQKSPDISTIVLAAYYGVPHSSSSALQHAIFDTAVQLKAAGKHVIIIGPYPGIDGHTDIPSHVARGGQQYVDAGAMHDVSVLRAQAEGVATVIYPTEIMCPHHRCRLVIDGSVMFFDAHHPSMHGAELVAPTIKRIIDNKQEKLP